MIAATDLGKIREDPLVREGALTVKAYEFEAPINPNGTVTLPPEVAAGVGASQTVRLIVLVRESSEEEEEAAWRRFGMEQFAKGYAPSDAIYDDL